MAVCLEEAAVFRMQGAPMTKASYTDQQREAALRYLQEHPLAEAARKAGVPKNTLRTWAQKAGIRTDDGAEKTRAAGEAAAARRHRVREENMTAMVEKVADLLGRMDEPHVDFKVVGGSRDDRGTVEQVTFPRATSGDVRNYAVSVGVLIDKVRLESGEATDRHEFTGDPNRVGRLRDELAERRARHAS